MKPHLEQRNSRIRADFAAGKSSAWLSATYDLSLTQVNKILRGLLPPSVVTDPHAAAPLTEWERNIELVHLPPIPPGFLDALEDVATGSSSESCVYFVQEADQPYVKIGISTANDINLRIGQLNVGNPRPLVLRRLVRGDRLTEAMLHRHFLDYRVRGEWFLADGELARVARTV